MKLLDHSRCPIWLFSLYFFSVIFLPPGRIIYLNNTLRPDTRSCLNYVFIIDHTSHHAVPGSRATSLSRVWLRNFQLFSIIIQKIITYIRSNHPKIVIKHAKLSKSRLLECAGELFVIDNCFFHYQQTTAREERTKNGKFSSSLARWCLFNLVWKICFKLMR